METPINLRISSIYGLFFDRIQIKAICHIQEDSFSQIGLVKEKLLIKLKKINMKIDKNTNYPILAAQSHLLSGLSQLHRHPEDFEGCYAIFTNALKESIQGFDKATNCFEIKTLATNIRVICTLHLHDYFRGHGVRSFINEELASIWNDYIHSIEVQSSIRDEFHKNFYHISSSSKTRKEILFQVAEMRSTLSLLTGSRMILHDHKGRDINLEGMKLKSLRGHVGKVNALAIHNGRLYSGSDDRTIKIWDLSSSSSNRKHSEPIRTLTGHTDRVLALTVYDGRLYSASKDRTVRVWDISSASGIIRSETIHALSGYVIHSLTAHDGRLYLGFADDGIKVWDLSSISSGCIDPFEPILSLKGHDDVAYALAVHNDRLYSGSWDSTIKVWDIASLSDSRPSEPIQTLSGHSKWVQALTVHDGKLYSASQDDTIKVWDISSSDSVPEEPIQTLRNHSYPQKALAVHNGRLHTGYYDSSIKVWICCEKSIISSFSQSHSLQLPY